MVAALFLLWLFLTMLDMAISGMALDFGGAREIGLLFTICGDFNLMCLIKGVTAFIFGSILVAYNEEGLLGISCGLYALLCIWNSQVLLKSMNLG